MIRNIIFDIGNVLTDYRWEGFLADKGFDAEMIKKIAKASIMHPLWAEYDRGTWTDEQVLAAFVKDAPELEKELHQAFENIAGMVTPRAYAILVTGTESKGIPCVLSVQLLTQGRDRMCGSVEFPAGDGRWHPVLQGSADQARTGDLPAASETLWIKGR